MATTASYGSWVLRCMHFTQPAQTAADTGKSGRACVQTCEVIQSVHVQGQSQPIAQVAIGRLSGDKDLVLTARVPANIAMPRGIHCLATAIRLSQPSTRRDRRTPHTRGLQKVRGFS